MQSSPQRTAQAARRQRATIAIDAAGGRLLICPLCFNAKQLAAEDLMSNADLGGTVQLWDWIGEGATTFSF